MNRHGILAGGCILIIAVALTMALNFCSGHQSESTDTLSNPGGTVVPSSQSTADSSEEMRAVWVPYMSLDMSKDSDKSEQAFQNKFNSIVNQAKSSGMNTLVVQVRPFGDALYQSSYFPWSHITGGTQGTDPGYDPLKDMVDACHSAGLKIHAWVNPLRIKSSGTPSILAPSNPYVQWQNDSSKSDWTVTLDSGIFYNPAYADVRTLIANGVREIAQNYAVDGIQFDDYFYPTQDASFDSTAYEAYCAQAGQKGQAMSLSDWRCANINALVAQVYQAVKSANPQVEFGISPQANLENDLKSGADVAAWCSAQGYVDYICPQLYVNFQNPVLPYDTAAKTWSSLVTNKNIKLYFGLALYKANSDADSGTWKNSSGILASEIEYGRQVSCSGFMFYSCQYLTGAQTEDEVQDVIKLLN